MSKTLLKAFFLSFTILLFTQKAYANVDISLEDNKELQEISVIVNSNGAKLPGVDLSIVFSENTKIKEITKTDFCNLLFEGSSKENKINIECFNNEEIEMNGEMAKIKYEKSGDKYSFYIDSEHTDVGTEKIGEIKDINKPVAAKNQGLKSETSIKSLSRTSIILIVAFVICLILGGIIIWKRFKKSSQTS